METFIGSDGQRHHVTRCKVCGIIVRCVTCGVDHRLPRASAYCTECYNASRNACARCADAHDRVDHDGSPHCRVGASPASGGTQPHCTCAACF